MAKKTAWDIVMLARDSQRPKAKDYIENILKDYDIIIPNNQLVPQNSVKEQYYCKHSAE